MKVLVNAEKLERALNPIAKVSATDRIRPIADYVLCSASKQGSVLKLHGIGSESAVSAEIKCDVIEDGTCLFPIIPLAKLLSTKRQAVIELRSKRESTCEAEYGDAVVTADTPGVEEFPNVPQDNTEILCSLSSLEFLEAMSMSVTIPDSRALYATDVTRFICFDTRAEGSLRIVSTDGRRMLVYTIRGEHDKRTAVLVPPAVSKLLRSCELGDNVDIWYDGNRIRFDCNDEFKTTITAMLGAGTFPRWESVLKITQPVLARFSFVAESLLSALRIANLASTRDHCRVRITTQDGKVTLSAKGDNGLETEIQETMDGSGEASVFLDGTLLMSFLRGVPQDAELTAEIHEGQTPFVIQQEGSWLYLQMPLAVRSEDS